MSALVFPAFTDTQPINECVPLIRLKDWTNMISCLLFVVVFWIMETSVLELRQLFM